MQQTQTAEYLRETGDAAYDAILAADAAATAAQTPAEKARRAVQQAAAKKAFNAPGGPFAGNAAVQAMTAELAASHTAYVKKYGEEHRSGLSKLGHSIGDAASKITNNPVWSVVQAGASFIPGAGTVVSAAMATAAAVGRGESFKDIAMSAGRAALPGGPLVQAAWDVGMGIAKGESLTNIAKGAIAAQLPGGQLGQMALNAVSAVASGANITSVGKDAIRSQLSPAQQQAFDAAMRAAQGGSLADIGRDLVAKNIPGGVAGRAAFNAAQAVARGGHLDPKTIVATLQAVPGPHQQIVASALRAASEAKKTMVSVPSLSSGANQVLRALTSSPAVRAMQAEKIATRLAVTTQDAKQGLAHYVSRAAGQGRAIDHREVGPSDSAVSVAMRSGVRLAMQRPGRPNVSFSRQFVQRLYDRGNATIRQSLVANGHLANFARDTGELSGRTWILRSGDTGSSIAQALTGDPNRWPEIVKANPGYTTYKDAKGYTQIKPWGVNQKVQMPAAWIPTLSGGSIVVGDRPTLSMGSQGPDVVYWQQTIGAPITGVFDATTDAWTRAWQGQYGLPVTGTVGPQTWGMVDGFATGTDLRFKGPVTVAPAAPQGPFAPPELPTPVAPTIPAYVPPIPRPSVPGTPIPSAPPTLLSIDPGSLQSDQQWLSLEQAMLAAFNQYHSDTAMRAMGWGTAADLSGQWNDRTMAATAAYQNWANARGAKLRTDGVPDTDTVTALRAQLQADDPANKQPLIQRNPATVTAAKSAKSDNGIAVLALVGLGAKVAGWI